MDKRFIALGITAVGASMMAAATSKPARQAITQTYKDIEKVVLDMTTPKGIRNNNPGNIEYNAANNWQGQTGSDGRFIIFDKMENGIRALTVLLINYYNRHGCKTVNQMINRWAPPTDNNPTSAYAKYVADFAGLDPNQQINLDSDLFKIVQGVIKFENGRTVEPRDLIAGFSIGMHTKGYGTMLASYNNQFEQVV